MFEWRRQSGRYRSGDVKSLFEIHTALPTQELQERETEAKSKDPYTRVSQLFRQQEK